MSTHEGPATPARKCCKTTYRVRWFHSKGAGLILFWNFCVFGAEIAIIELATKLVDKRLLGVISLIPIVVCAPLSGWLADAKFGNYKVFKSGSIIIFIGAIISCPFTLVLENLPMPGTAGEFSFKVTFAVLFSVEISGSLICFVTSLQLGLDQMPDASAENIASYISWFFLSTLSGCWIGSSLYSLQLECIFKKAYYVQIWSLFPVFCLCAILCSDYIVASKWLIVEPQSPQSLKNIFRVLRFAAKHKAPINRSALTYWEEDIPSRMDLGKSRYGGPFTTEQVEDVKTILKLLIVFLPLWLIMPSLLLHETHYALTPSFKPPGYSACTSTVLFVFTYSPTWCAILGAIFYEFLVYPLINYKLPSILKRIGIASFLIMLLNMVYLICRIVNYVKQAQAPTWSQEVHLGLNELVIFFLLTCVYEFMCAQAPYSSRSLLVGYTTLVLVFSVFITGGTTLVYERIRADTKLSHYSILIHDSFAIILSIAGFILHCILAHWYKRRVRDDISTPHRWVEEVYDRYLSQDHY